MVTVRPAKPTEAADPRWSERLRLARERLDCRFPAVQAVFEKCLLDAVAVLSEDALDAYLDRARWLGKIGRGDEPVRAFLEQWPKIAAAVGEDTLPAVERVLTALHKSPNARTIAPFLRTLATVANRLLAEATLPAYLELVVSLMERSSGSIHGIHQTFASPALPEFFSQSATLLDTLTLDGLRQWVDYGLRNHPDHPERLQDYFGLRSPDSRAVWHRQRRGVQFSDHQRLLELFLRALWNDPGPLQAYPVDPEKIRRPSCDAAAIYLPDALDTHAGVDGLDRYRAILAHLAGHRGWSRPIFADNFSPLQRLAIEVFEDCRIDTLILRRYPGLRKLFLALHPAPRAGDCDPRQRSCLRHRLTMLSRALLDAEHGYTDATLIEFVARFQALLADGQGAGEAMVALALAWVARTRQPSDQSAEVHFAGTEIDYRDDNRHLWQFHELSDDEEMFESRPPPPRVEEAERLPPCYYPEWDYATQSYRPDWVSVYESLHPAGDSAHIDQLLARHERLTRRLKRLLDHLRPQDRVRVRYREDGSELDLDIALRSLIDLKSGVTPEPRINMSHRRNGRNLAVTLLLDLSQSLADKVTVGDGQQSILELSQEAVSLLAWSIEQLGDLLAIAGFHSNTRNDVRYLHFKGYGESWHAEVKSRLAAMQAGGSTRMGPAIRHATRMLQSRRTEKKLLLILTDGQPADVDVQDDRLLIEDARKAVEEAERLGVFTYCISLDPRADDYVSDIFGRRYTVIDHIERLPERLPQLFMSLTR
ncbi:MAG: VWA domain-containing protein [Candidatus Accumulibacter sp.]|nr:VWA domain-containing protein [Accumulibacter sp.]